MDHQYFEIQKKYITYFAELFNPEGEVISSTKIVQKNRKNSDMMMDEVGQANKLTSTVPPLMMAQIWRTYAYADQVLEFNMN